MLNVVNDIINQVSLSHVRPGSSELEMCEVDMEMVVRRLVVKVDTKLVTRYSKCLQDGRLRGGGGASLLISVLSVLYNAQVKINSISRDGPDCPCIPVIARLQNRK